MNDIAIVLTYEEAKALKLLLLHEIRDNQKGTINTPAYWDALRSIQDKLGKRPRPTLVVDLGKPNVFGGFNIEWRQSDESLECLYF